MTKKSSPPILALRKQGWIEVGGARAFLMDASGGFLSMRQQLAQELGAEAEAEICRRAGAASADRLVENLLNTQAISENAEGFKTVVSLFSSSGYGQFEVTDMNFDEGWAKIRAFDSVEGWMYNEESLSRGCVCDYAKGFFTGALRSLKTDSTARESNEKNDSWDDEFACVETGCIAGGDSVCSFVAARSSQLLAMGIQPGIPAQSSIRETLLRLNQQLENILDHSRKDHLTGLFNRAYFETTLRQRIGFAKRRSDVLSLAIIDVDHFKKINDTLGHASGDRVLRQLAWILEKQARENDIVARYGGDEFVWVMPATSSETAYLVAQRILDNLRSMHGEIGYPLTVSIGIAAYPCNASSPAELLIASDSALYTAKESGRDKVCVFSEKQSVPPASSVIRTPDHDLLDQLDPFDLAPLRAALTPPSSISADKKRALKSQPSRRILIKSRLRSARSGRGR
jgi:diguanylate cyclase (GGDEF)-like protein